MKKAIPIQDETKAQPLWTTQDCANYLRISQRQFQDRVMNLPGFPTPIRLPSPKGGRGHPRWHGQEIITWADQQRVAA